MEKINYLERRKNVITVYYSNGIGCPQPATHIIKCQTVEEAKEKVKELKKAGEF